MESAVITAPPEPEPDWTDKDYVKGRIAHYSELYAVSASDMIQMAYCESKLNVKAFNASDPYGGAHGLFQFLKPTFYGFAKQYGLEEPDIWNPEQQLDMTARMVSEGGATHWTCARKLHLFGL